MSGSVGRDRGIGLTDVLQRQAELPLVVLFALITQLGDVWFLFLLGGVLYVGGSSVPGWGLDRRRGLFVLALVITYVALIGVFKSVFAAPRPLGAGKPPALGWIPSVFEVLFADITTAAGPGFPSGHALGSTMVWGGLALVYHRGTYRGRFGVAGVIVALVSVSRLVLGVHYFVDVLAGIVLGVITLGVLYRVAESGTAPGRVLLASIAIGLVGIFASLGFESVAALGAAIGGWGAWRSFAGTVPDHPGNRRDVLVEFVVLGLAGGLFGGLYALHPPVPITFLGTAIAVGTVVAAPILCERPR